jgi:hypothetical protein
MKKKDLELRVNELSHNVLNLQRRVEAFENGGDKGCEINKVFKVRECSEEFKLLNEELKAINNVSIEGIFERMKLEPMDFNISCFKSMGDIMPFGNCNIYPEVAQRFCTVNECEVNEESINLIHESIKKLSDEGLEIPILLIKAYHKLLNI